MVCEGLCVWGFVLVFFVMHYFVFFYSAYSCTCATIYKFVQNSWTYPTDYTLPSFKKTGNNCFKKIQNYVSLGTFPETKHIWATTCDFQQCGILKLIDSGEFVLPPVKLRNSIWCSVSSLTFIEYSRDYQRLWSVCAYAQVGLSLCLSHIPHCWKSHIAAQLC